MSVAQTYKTRSTAANGNMRACGDAGLQFRVSRVRDKVRVAVRVSDCVRVSTFCFLSH